MYTRKSRNPSPKDNMPKKYPPPVTSHEEQSDDLPEAQNEELGESNEAEDHLDTDGEEFHEGKLDNAKAKVEKVI